MPPELAARFAEAERQPRFRQAMRPPPRFLWWMNLALLIVVVGGVTVGIWVLAFTARDFADDRGKGASIAGIVTALMAFAGWVGLRELRTRTTGAPRSVLASVAEKSEDNDLSIGSATRYRVCRATFITRGGEVESHELEPSLFDELRVGEIGVVYFRDDTVIEFRQVLAAAQAENPAT